MSYQLYNLSFYIAQKNIKINVNVIKIFYLKIVRKNAIFAKKIAIKMKMTGSSTCSQIKSDSSEKVVADKSIVVPDRQFEAAFA